MLLAGTRGKAPFSGVLPEDAEFFELMGWAALNTRNCFAAASEFRNMCFERDSRSSVIWFMGKYSIGVG